MSAISPLILVALAILLIEAGRELLAGDYFGAARTVLVVVLVALGLRRRRPPSPR